MTTDFEIANCETTSDLAGRAQKAVEKAYREATDKTPRPIFSIEMLALAHATDDSDPLCLYRYFHLTSPAEWYVISAEKLGSNAHNMLTGESAAGSIQFFAFACLGDPDRAEVGIVPLDRASGMGLRDIRAVFHGVASVELDRYYTPVRLSVIRERLRGQ